MLCCTTICIEQPFETFYLTWLAKQLGVRYINAVRYHDTMRCHKIVCLLCCYMASHFLRLFYLICFIAFYVLYIVGLAISCEIMRYVALFQGVQ